MWGGKESEGHRVKVLQSVRFLELVEKVFIHVKFVIPAPYQVRGKLQQESSPSTSVRTELTPKAQDAW